MSRPSFYYKASKQATLICSDFLPQTYSIVPYSTEHQRHWWTQLKWQESHYLVWSYSDCRILFGILYQLVNNYNGKVPRTHLRQSNQGWQHLQLYHWKLRTAIRRRVCLWICLLYNIWHLIPTLWVWNRPIPCQVFWWRLYGKFHLWSLFWNSSDLLWLSSHVIQTLHQYRNTWHL